MKWGRPEQESADRPITTPAQLLVEGRTPEIFFREFVADLGLREQVEVRTFGSIHSLGPWLELFSSKAAFKERVTRLAIIRDAEADPALAAFQSVCTTLRRSSLPVPDHLGKFADTLPSVGVFILPDCDQAGMLETLCLQAVLDCEGSAIKKVLPCVDELLVCARNAGTSFEDETKARFAGYVLAKGVVDPQLGRAAQKKIIPCGAGAFATLAQFIRTLAVG